MKPIITTKKNVRKIIKYLLIIYLSSSNASMPKRLRPSEKVIPTDLIKDNLALEVSISSLFITLKSAFSFPKFQ